jgi:hypothetical protein
VEKSIRVLQPKGALTLIVPSGIASQPAAAPLRSVLGTAGEWSLSSLDADVLGVKASVSPALLELKKGSPAIQLPATGLRLDEIAEVHVGIATGADRIFVLDQEAAQRSRIEPDFLRPAVRGKDVGRSRDICLVWPYDHNRKLVDLEDLPGLEAYLKGHEELLRSRPRLRLEIARNPDAWFRFIQLPPKRSSADAPRFAIPDIIGKSRWEEIQDPQIVLLNTCFEITPREGRYEIVRGLLESHAFWSRLHESSRTLTSHYYRSSVTEVRAISIGDLVKS